MAIQNFDESRFVMAPYPNRHQNLGVAPAPIDPFTTVYTTLKEFWTVTRFSVTVKWENVASTNKDSPMSSANSLCFMGTLKVAGKKKEHKKMCLKTTKKHTTI